MLSSVSSVCLAVLPMCWVSDAVMEAVPDTYTVAWLSYITAIARANLGVSGL